MIFEITNRANIAVQIPKQTGFLAIALLIHFLFVETRNTFLLIALVQVQLYVFGYLGKVVFLKGFLLFDDYWYFLQRFLLLLLYFLRQEFFDRLQHGVGAVFFLVWLFFYSGQKRVGFFDEFLQHNGVSIAIDILVSLATRDLFSFEGNRLVRI